MFIPDYRVIWIIRRVACSSQLVNWRMSQKEVDWDTPKPSLKIKTASTIFWDYLGMFRDYGQKYFFMNKTFCFSRQKAETFSICLKMNFVKLHKVSTYSAHSDNCYLHFFFWLFDWVEILWGFTKLTFKQILKVSASYLEKQKSFTPKDQSEMNVTLIWLLTVI